MTLRSILILLLAVACGGSAVVGVKSLTPQPAAAAAPETVPVVVAAAEIPRGVSITAEQLKTRAFPKDYLAPGMITNVKDAVDRVSLGSFATDKPIFEEQLADKRGGRGWAAMIPHGMRAFTILTPTLASNVSGFLMPGNRVDVLLTVNSSSNDDLTGGGSTTTLLQHVEIWAVGQRVEVQPDNKVDAKEMQSVTLLVTPDQAAKLDLGQNKGTLHLSLRNPEDSAAAKTQPATLADMRFHQERPWDERAKGVLEAVNKLIQQARAKMAQAAAKAPALPKEDPAVQIRTLRGPQESAVIVKSPSGSGGR
jgi:pilus assembly protein CpaB